MVVTFKGLDSYLNIASGYSRKSSASILNIFVDIISLIGVRVKTLFVSVNIIKNIKIYNLSLSHLCNMGIYDLFFIKIVRKVGILIFQEIIR